jgi:hypothetical protein
MPSVVPHDRVSTRLAAQNGIDGGSLWLPSFAACVRSMLRCSSSAGMRGVARRAHYGHDRGTATRTPTVFWTRSVILTAPPRPAVIPLEIGGHLEWTGPTSTSKCPGMQAGLEAGQEAVGRSAGLALRHAVVENRCYSGAGGNSVGAPPGAVRRQQRNAMQTLVRLPEQALGRPRQVSAARWTMSVLGHGTADSPQGGDAATEHENLEPTDLDANPWHAESGADDR